MALHWPDALYADCGAVPGDQQKDSLYRFLFLDGGAGPLSDALACFSGIQPHCEGILLYQGKFSGREAFCKNAKGAEYYYEGSDPSHIRIFCLELLYGIYHDGRTGSISGNADFHADSQAVPGDRIYTGIFPGAGVRRTDAAAQ